MVSIYIKLPYQFVKKPDDVIDSRIGTFLQKIALLTSSRAYINDYDCTCRHCDGFINDLSFTIILLSAGCTVSKEIFFITSLLGKKRPKCFT